MTTQLLATELANLVHESKRKNNDLRQAAEKALEELKGLRATNESQVAAELSQRANFVNPFIIACGTKNVKFTSIAIVCLQRLILAKAIPRAKLHQVLEALREATSAGLDVQLKILQVLPSLVQNYSADVKGDLLVTALNICFILQSSKNAIVNNTSAATLQQLVVFVFDKVAASGSPSASGPLAGDSSAKEPTSTQEDAALDAYRIFNDLCLLTENQRPEYLRFTGLPQTFGLELIESVLTNHASIFLAHQEQAEVLRSRVMPFITSALKSKQNFATTVRLMRVLYTLLRRHLDILAAESADALEILTRLLDQDTTLWRRALCMEVFRGIFAEPSLVRRIFALYDARPGERDILKTITSTFVRISTEKPAVIGLGHQSTIPVANPYANIGSSTEQAMLESSGVTGIISSSVAAEAHNTGISSQWSTVRVPCIDQLDKTEPPPVPESYIYSLTLSCISSMSEGLAKFILPLTVPADTRARKKNVKEAGRESPAPLPSQVSEVAARGNLERSASFKRNPVPLNPLTMTEHPLYDEVKICSAIIDECWPAILATCSTFLYAALDSEYYHTLVRSFQRFTHVAGLIQLNTPRDAFLTTLGKAAVPPNVFTACLNAGIARPQPHTPVAESPSSILGNARGLLNVDSLVSQGSPAAEKGRQQSLDGSSTSLNTRNLLCLRALLNLGIALGPTLGSSWRIVFETLQQADFVLFSTSKAAGRTPLASKSTDQQAENEANLLLANFSTEIKAVETAGSRLIESTVDFPNASFVEVVVAICNLLERKSDKVANNGPPESLASGSALKTPTGQHRRVLSISTVAAGGPNQEDQFALAKLGDIASINMERLLAYASDVSGWKPLTSELIRTLSSLSMSATVRLRAADILVKFILEAANTSVSFPESQRGPVQLRLLKALQTSLLPLQDANRDVSVMDHGTDVETHKIILEGLNSILENCGETIVSGWEIVFDLIGSIFVPQKVASEEKNAKRDRKRGMTALTTHSPKLIRSSFNSLQLVCSDFLASLPNPCFVLLVDTLFKFCSQHEDLNIALTTVTFFWVLSDFLSSKTASLALVEEQLETSNGLDALGTGHLASDQEAEGLASSLWMLLLLRLTSVTADERLELRNSAIQTLLRIFDAYGDKMSSDTWILCIKSVIFRLLSSVEEELQRHAKDADRDQQILSDWHETAVVVLGGISVLLQNYLDILVTHSSFNSLWQELISHFGTLLDCHVLAVSTATFKAFSLILCPPHNGSQQYFDRPTIEGAWKLWSKRVPVSRDDDGQGRDNQACLMAYISALQEVYRLVSPDLTIGRLRRVLELLRDSMQQASAGAYANDVEYATQLQSQILDGIKMIRTDITGAPSALISQVAEFVSLAFMDASSELGQRPQRRTYVAMSKASMSILQSLILKHAADLDIYTSGAFSEALQSLCTPVVQKYSFAVQTKSIQPWKLATSTTLEILERTLPQTRTLEIPQPIIQGIWQIVVKTADGILGAESPKAPREADLLQDEAFDIRSFHKLRELIIPALGGESVSDSCRKAFAESIFRASIVHPPPPSGFGASSRSSVDVDQSSVNKPRLGQTTDRQPARRRKMAYVCLEELYALLESRDDSVTPTILVQPPTPVVPVSPLNRLSEPPHVLRVRIARIVAPFLILRVALTLQTYIADQPLRGRMPQPLSQRTELLTVLRYMIDLKSEPEAIPNMQSIESESRNHLLKLYPLVAAGVKVAGRSGDETVLVLLTQAVDLIGRELEG